jgi:hypothetical protein
MQWVCEGECVRWRRFTPKGVAFADEGGFGKTIKASHRTA